MPDSFSLPPEGQQSHDDRALDSLLSGDTSDIPAPLRSVADTLNALRAAPSARELRGETAAREQFRTLFHQAETGAGGSRTLEMPAVPAHRRRGAHVRAVRRRPLRTRLAALTVAAAVLVLAAAVTYTGNLPSRLQRIAHDTISAPAARPASGSAMPGTQATSASPMAPTTVAPVVSVPASEAPAPSPGPQDKKALCDQFWLDLKHPRPGPMSWRTPRYSQLVTDAGGPQNVFGYCYPVWDPRFGPHQYRHLASYPPYFPRQWGSDGSQGNGQVQRPGQQQNPGNQREPGSDQGNQPTPADSGGPQPGNSDGPQPGNQGQGSGSPAS